MQQIFQSHAKMSPADNKQKLRMRTDKNGKKKIIESVILYHQFLANLQALLRLESQDTEQYTRVLRQMP